MKTLSRATRILPSVFAGLAGTGYLYQTIATARDQRQYPPPGKLIEIGGVRLHVQAMGEGSPTVVLETGLGGMSSAWAWIQPEVAKFTRVVSYDRAGLGWSERDPAPQSPAQSARRLRRLLDACGLPSPFVLVGHSMGGLLVRVFADHYPDDIAGMVLLDPSHPDQHLRSPAISKHMTSGFQMLRRTPLLARLGYIRLSGYFSSWADGLPPKEHAVASAFLCSHRHLSTTRDESAAWDRLCAEVRCTRGLGNMPLAVMSAGRDVLPGAPELHGELAALSKNGFHVAVERADHVTLVTHREHAMKVVETIRQVVQMASSPSEIPASIANCSQASVFSKE